MVSNIALFVTALGVFGVVFGLRQSYLERLQQFEGKYVARYWDILDRLSLDALKGAYVNPIPETDNKNIRCYILLCEDELEMRGNGYISDRTYDLWADGIRTQFQEQPFKEIWRQVQEEAKNNHNFLYVNLRLLLANESTQRYDPLVMSTWRKRVRGLTGLRWVKHPPAASIAGAGRSEPGSTTKIPEATPSASPRPSPDGGCPADLTRQAGGGHHQTDPVATTGQIPRPSPDNYHARPRADPHDP